MESNKNERTPQLPEAQSEEILETRQDIERTVRADEIENRAHVLKNHIMGLARLRRWYDAHGSDVGLVAPDGRPLKEDIEKALLRTGVLIQAEDPEELPEDIQRKLEEAAGLMDPELAASVKEILDPIEEALKKFREKIPKLEKNPNYLFEFKRGGAFRNDLMSAIHLMGPAASGHERIANNVWVLKNETATHFITDKRLAKKRQEMIERQIDEPGQEVRAAEHLARFELHEELREETQKLAEKDEGDLEIAKRMPGLMQGQLDLLLSGVAGQAKGLFDDQELELGETDADSMIAALDTLNRCLLCLIDIQRTKKVIPSLA